MSDFDPPPSNDKSNRFDGASVPRSRSDVARSEGVCSDAVRDVTIEALLRRLDEALAAIRSLDSDVPLGPEGEGGGGDDDSAA